MCIWPGSGPGKCVGSVVVALPGVMPPRWSIVAVCRTTKQKADVQPEVAEDVAGGCRPPRRSEHGEALGRETPPQGWRTRGLVGRGWRQDGEVPEIYSHFPPLSCQVAVCLAAAERSESDAARGGKLWRRTRA